MHQLTQFLAISLDLCDNIVAVNQVIEQESLRSVASGASDGARRINYAK